MLQPKNDLLKSKGAHTKDRFNWELSDICSLVFGHWQLTKI